MSYWVLSLTKSVLFIGMFVVAVSLCIPKGTSNWKKWKESGKSTDLSSSAASFCAALFFITADLLIFIKDVLGEL